MTTKLFKRRSYDSLTTEEKLDVIIDRLESLASAFPEGPEKHRESHEAWMAAKKAETLFWEDLKLDLVKKGVWGLIIIFTGLVLLGLSVKLGYYTRY